jgi:hypothetical protein
MGKGKGEETGSTGRARSCAGMLARLGPLNPRRMAALVPRSQPGSLPAQGAAIGSDGRDQPQRPFPQPQARPSQRARQTTGGTPEVRAIPAPLRRGHEATLCGEEGAVQGGRAVMKLEDPRAGHGTERRLSLPLPQRTISPIGREHRQARSCDVNGIRWPVDAPETSVSRRPLASLWPRQRRRVRYFGLRPVALSAAVRRPTSPESQSVSSRNSRLDSRMASVHGPTHPASSRARRLVNRRHPRTDCCLGPLHVQVHAAPGVPAEPRTGSAPCRAGPSNREHP